MNNNDATFSEYKLILNSNDISSEIKQWIDNCETQKQPLFNIDLSVINHNEYNKYTNRIFKLAKYAEHCARQYNKKISYSTEYYEIILNTYNKQTAFYNLHRNNYKDLYIDSETTAIKNSILYNNLFLNIDGVSSDKLNTILDNLASEDMLAAPRRAYINSAEEITQSDNYIDIAGILLKLGYDIEFTTKDISYNKITDEILKTCNSVITFDTKSKVPFLSGYKKNKILKLYKNNGLGEIKII